MKNYRIKELQKIVHKIAKEKGFWGNICHCKDPYFFYDTHLGYTCGNCDGINGLGDRNNAEMIALMHSELSEALEGLRREDWKNVGEEMGDLVIRVMDFCEARDIDLEKEILKKIKKNKKRKYRHGKRF